MSRAGTRLPALALLCAVPLAGCASVQGHLRDGDLASACRLLRPPPGSPSRPAGEEEQQALHDALRARLRVTTRPLEASEVLALLGEAPARPLDLRHLQVQVEAPLQARVVQAGWVGAPVKLEEDLKVLPREDAERLQQGVEALVTLDRALAPLPPPPAPREEVAPLSPRVEPPPRPVDQAREAQEAARLRRLGAAVDRLFVPCLATPGAPCAGLFLGRPPGPQAVVLQVWLEEPGACLERVTVPLAPSAVPRN